MMENLESSNSNMTPNHIYRNSLTNPSFYISDKGMKQESKYFSESDEVIKEEKYNKKLLDSRCFSSRTDNRNKLLRESFIW